LKVVDIQLITVSKRLDEKKIRLELTDKARTVIAQQGFDPAYGARPLKRAIQRLILDPLAHKLIAGEIKEGATVKVDASKNGDGHLVFSANIR